MGDQREQQAFFYTTTKRVGFLPFYLISAGEFRCDSSYYTRRQGLFQFLFIGTVSGSGQLCYEGVTQPLQAGNAVVIDCSKYHYYASQGDVPWHFVWFHFQGTGADSFVRLLNGKSLRLLDWDAQRTVCEELKSLSVNTDRNTDLKISLWIHSFLGELSAGQSDPELEPYFEVMSDAARFLRSSYAQPLSLDQLAQKYSLSKFHFLRLFKRYTGQTPYEYLTIARIGEAKRLLASTSEGLEEIAAQSGYTDVKTLIRSFKQHTGTTPARFRRQLADIQTD